MRGFRNRTGRSRGSNGMPLRRRLRRRARAGARAGWQAELSFAPRGAGAPPRTVLSLRWGHTRPTPLRVSENHADLLPAYEAMRAFAGRGVDRTLGAERLPDGTVLRLHRAPMGSRRATGDGLRLTASSAEVMRFEPGLAGRGVALLLALAGAVPLTLAAFAGGVEARAACLLGGTPLFFGGLAGAFWPVEKRGLVFDRAMDAIQRPAGLAGLKPPRREALISEAAAVQLCGERVDARRVFELNVLLRCPDGARFNILRHPAEARVRAHALALAAFLGKPLLDHTP